MRYVVILYVTCACFHWSVGAAEHREGEAGPAKESAKAAPAEGGDALGDKDCSEHAVGVLESKLNRLVGTVTGRDDDNSGLWRLAADIIELCPRAKVDGDFARQHAMIGVDDAGMVSYIHTAPPQLAGAVVRSSSKRHVECCPTQEKIELDGKERLSQMLMPTLMGNRFSATMSGPKATQGSTRAICSLLASAERDEESVAGLHVREWYGPILEDCYLGCVDHNKGLVCLRQTPEYEVVVTCAKVNYPVHLPKGCSPYIHKGDESVNVVPHALFALDEPGERVVLLCQGLHKELSWLVSPLESSEEAGGKSAVISFTQQPLGAPRLQGQLLTAFVRRNSGMHEGLPAFMQWNITTDKQSIIRTFDATLYMQPHRTWHMMPRVAAEVAPRRYIQAMLPSECMKMRVVGKVDAGMGLTGITTSPNERYIAWHELGVLDKSEPGPHQSRVVVVDRQFSLWNALGYAGESVPEPKKGTPEHARLERSQKARGWMMDIALQYERTDQHKKPELIPVDESSRAAWECFSRDVRDRYRRVFSRVKFPAEARIEHKEAGGLAPAAKAEPAAAAVQLHLPHKEV